MADGSMQVTMDALSLPTGDLHHTLSPISMGDFTRVRRTVYSSSRISLVTHIRRWRIRSGD